MGSSKVMTSSTSRNSDLRMRSSSSSAKSSSMISELHLHYKNKRVKDNTKGSSDLGSMTIGGLLRNVHGDDNEASRSTLLDTQITTLDAAGAVTAISDNEAGGKLAIRRLESASSNSSGKNVEDAWKEIIAGRIELRQCKQEVMDEMMTLEDFLAKAEAVEEEDLKIGPGSPPMGRLGVGIFAFDPIPPSSYPTSADSVLGFGNGGELVGGRGKRRAVMEPLDKAAQQRQRRMIKNRESAARSRERKQAYQVELEALAVKLEQENELLLKEMAEQMNERYKQIKEKVIPVEEMQRPKLGLRRVNSMDW